MRLWQWLKRRWTWWWVVAALVGFTGGWWSAGGRWMVSGPEVGKVDCSEVSMEGLERLPHGECTERIKAARAMVDESAELVRRYWKVCGATSGLREECGELVEDLDLLTCRTGRTLRRLEVQCGRRSAGE